MKRPRELWPFINDNLIGSRLPVLTARRIATCTVNLCRWWSMWHACISTRIAFKNISFVKFSKTENLSLIYISPFVWFKKENIVRNGLPRFNIAFLEKKYVSSYVVWAKFAGLMISYDVTADIDCALAPLRIASMYWLIHSLSMLWIL